MIKNSFYPYNHWEHICMPHLEASSYTLFPSPCFFGGSQPHCKYHSPLYEATAQALQHAGRQIQAAFEGGRVLRMGRWGWEPSGSCWFELWDLPETPRISAQKPRAAKWGCLLPQSHMSLSLSTIATFGIRYLDLKKEKDLPFTSPLQTTIYFLFTSMISIQNASA